MFQMVTGSCFGPGVRGGAGGRQPGGARARPGAAGGGEVRAYVARQLSAAAVPGLGGSWGGAAAGPAPPPPRCVWGLFRVSGVFRARRGQAGAPAAQVCLGFV